MNTDVLFYSSTVVSVIGLFANLLCVILFSIIIKKCNTNGKMYNYLLLKSICDFILFVGYFFDPILNFHNLNLDKTYFYQLYFKYFCHYLNPLLVLYSIWFEVLATIDCYLTIENKYRFLLTKKAFIWSSFVNIIFFFLFYSSKLCVYQILQVNGTNNSTLLNEKHLYKTIKTHLYFGTFYKTLTFLYLFFRDIINNCLLIFFNIMIYLTLKRVVANRKKILKSNKASLLDSIKNQRNKSKMIYFSFINSLLFHSPDFVTCVYGKHHMAHSIFWVFYGNISFQLLMFSFAVPFFIYFTFNKVFANHFFKLVRLNRSINQIESI
jgi:hypothetical protein